MRNAALPSEGKAPEKCNREKEQNGLAKVGLDTPTLWKSQLDALKQRLIPAEPEGFTLTDPKPPFAAVSMPRQLFP